MTVEKLLEWMHKNEATLRVETYMTLPRDYGGPLADMMVLHLATTDPAGGLRSCKRRVSRSELRRGVSLERQLTNMLHESDRHALEVSDD